MEHGRPAAGAMMAPAPAASPMDGCDDDGWGRRVRQEHDGDDGRSTKTLATPIVVDCHGPSAGRLGGRSVRHGRHGRRLRWYAATRTSRMEHWSQNQAATGKIYFGLGATTDEGLQAAAPTAREQFVETAYWNPSVVTGRGRHGPRHADRADGPLALRVQGPGRHRRRYPGRPDDRRAAGPQDFFVELKVPGILTEGDTPRFQARLHHQGVRGPVEVRPAGVRRRERAGRSARRLRSTADGVEEVLFDPFEVPGGDAVRLDISARTGGEGGSPTS